MCNLKTLKILAIALSSLMFVGCSQTPRVTLKNYEEQDIGLVAKHWRSIASQTADSLITTQSVVGKGPVFVAAENSDSAFNKAFKEYLTSAFIEKGIPVSKKANNATAVVNFKAETYLYTKKGEDKSPFDKKTFWAVLYTLGNDFKEMAKSDLEINLLTLGLVWDMLDAKNKTTDAEVVLTVTVEDFNSVKYKKSTEFYIERNDLVLYWSDKAPYSSLLTNSESNKTIKAKTLTVSKK